MDIGFDILSSSSFFEDVPEEDEMPLDFEIPGPIPDLVDLYSLNKLDSYNNNIITATARVSVTGDDLMATHFNNDPKPSPRVCKRSNHNTIARVSVSEDDPKPNGSLKSNTCRKRKTGDGDHNSNDKNKKPRATKRSVETSVGNKKKNQHSVIKKRVETRINNNNNKNNSVSRVSKESTKSTSCSMKPRVCKRNVVKTCGRILSEESLTMLRGLEDMPPTVFIPKKKRSNIKTCGRIIGKKNPRANTSSLMLA